MLLYHTNTDFASNVGGENRICPSVARGGSEATDTSFQTVLFAEPSAAKHKEAKEKGTLFLRSFSFAT